MSYTADNHVTWTRRTQKWFLRLQCLREEGQRLHDIYSSEANSGSDADFVDNDIATKAEFQQGMTLIDAFKDFIENGVVPQTNRVPIVTNFLIVE